MSARTSRTFVVKLFLGLFAFLLVAPLRAEEVPCEGCGRHHDSLYQSATIILTDWRTNETHNYQSVWCTIRDMQTKYPWSRARWTTPGGAELSLTRTQNRWEARPAEAVALPLTGTDQCESVLAFASEEELSKWLHGPGKSAAHGDPIRLDRLPPTFVADDIAALPVVPYPDVSAEHWAASGVELATQAGLLEGAPDGKFHGDEEVVRYQVAVILERLLTRFVPRGTPADQVGAAPQGVWSTVTSELEQAGVSQVQAQQIVEIAAASDVPAAPAALAVSRQWPDVPEDHWAAPAVKLITSEGYMNGFPDGTFRGDDPLSRYQIAVILKRLLERLGIQPAPGQDSGSSTQGTFGLATGEMTEAMPIEASESAREQFLRRLQHAGFTREQAELALQALQDEDIETAQQPSTTVAEENSPDLPVTSRTPSHSQTPRTNDPGLLGQSGLLVTPTADILDPGLIITTASLMSDGDARAVGVGGTLDSGTEITATFTSGDLPDAILVSAKHPVYSSSDGLTRAAVGVLDATDEMDTTFYVVGSKDVSLGLLGRRPLTLSAGLGGGDLLDGLFLSGFTRLGSRTAAMLEWVGIGNEDQVNAGLSWAGPSGIRLKGGTVDSDFAASLSLNRGF